MRATIDKAGRVVIPASLRKKAGLVAGSALEIVADDISVRLLRSVAAAKLVRVGNRLVAKPMAKKVPAIDIAQWIDEERNRWPG